MRVQPDLVGVAALNGVDSPYTLVAVAPSAADLIDTCGGLLCDTAMSGWRTDVIVDGCADQAALTILGVRSRAATVIDAVSGGRAKVHVLVIAPALQKHGGSQRCDELAAIYDFSGADVIVCLTQSTGKRVAGEAFAYTPSTAAQLFKRHARAASGNALGLDEDVEMFTRPSVLPAQPLALAPVRAMNA